MAVSFFCTRCRTLLQFPATCSGSVVYCPKCQQAVIVPALPSHDTRDTVQETPDHLIPPLPKDLPPTTSRTIPVVRHLDEKAGERLYSFETHADIMVTPEPVSDDEFLQRLKTRPTSDAFLPSAPKPPVSNTSVPVVPPPVLKKSSDEKEENDAISGSFMFALVLAALFAFALTGWFVYHLFPEMFTPRKTTPQAQQVIHDPIAVDGNAIFYDADGRKHGDEGAIAILFPLHISEKEPLVVSTLAPDKPTPIDFEPHRRKLEALGGAFGRAASDGFIDLSIPQPGRYKILMVSAHVTRVPRDSDKKRIEEIASFLFQPEQTLLAGYAFFWEERTLDATHYRVEYNFGKKD